MALVGLQVRLLALGFESELGWQLSSLLRIKAPDCQAAALCQPRCPPQSGFQPTAFAIATEAC